MATFSAKDRRTYQNICHLSERGVLSLMRDALWKSHGQDKVTVTPAYVYAFGDIPVALVAHADTVFKLPPSIDNFFYDQEKDVIWNPDGAGADDRAGVFAILKLIRKYKFKPHVIITTGEESGCIGASKLIAAMPVFNEDLRFMIQLDRRGHKDAVYYDCDNEEFEKFITQFGFETEWGTLSDISVLAPVWGVAAVNVSVGYEDEHHEIERLHVDWLYETIDKVANILHYVQENVKDVQKYKYIPMPYVYRWRKGYGLGSNYLYDDDDDDIIDWSSPQEWEDCWICGEMKKKEELIPIYYRNNPHVSYNMCLQCHSTYADKVIWCKCCNKGYFLSDTEVKKIPDVNNWVCEDCKKHGRDEKDTGTVQSGTTVQPAAVCGKTTDGADFGGMGEEQRLVQVQRQLAHIRDPKSCNF